jgi:hypothetical protein
MRKRRSSHHAGLRAADRAISIDFGAACPESSSQSESTSITVLEQSLTAILSSDRSIAIFADGTAARCSEIVGWSGSLSKPRDREGDTVYAVEPSGRSIPTGWLPLPD